MDDSDSVGQVVRLGSTTTLASNLNPSNVGQQVTFTATVAVPGGTPAGNVLFKVDGNSVLLALLNAGGQATLALTSLSAGSHSIVAEYQGNSAVAPSTSDTVTQTVNAVGSITIVADPSGTPGTFEFTGDLPLTLTSFDGAPDSALYLNVPVGNVTFTAVPHPTFALLAITCTGDSDGGSSANAATGALTIDLDAGEAITCTFVFAEAVERAADIIAGFLERRQNSLVSVGPSFQHILDRFRGGGGTSNAANELAFFGAQMLAGQDTAFSTFFAHPNSPFSVWAEGRYDRYSDGPPGSRLFGSVLVVEAGLDYLIGPNALIGVMIAGDFAHERSTDLSYDIRGQGLLVGPYVAFEAGNLVIDVKLLWGRSWNTIQPFLTFTDQFLTTRWLASARISGEFAAGNFFIQPEAEIVWMRETQHAYLSNNVNPIPAQTVTTGRVTFGPRIGLNLVTDTLAIQPSLTLEGVWDFINNDLTARLGAGLMIAGENGVRLDINAGYEGLGSSFRSWSVGATLTIPFGGR